MYLHLKRLWPKPQYIIGHLYINSTYYCDTLERPPLSVPSPKGSVRESSAFVLSPPSPAYGKLCCIPPGTYKVEMYPSHHYKRMLPILMDVPGREGILIHQGNHVSDTTGCILVGWNRKVGYLAKSRAALDPLIARIQAAHSRGEEVTIEVTNG